VSKIQSKISASLSTVSPNWENINNPVPSIEEIFGSPTNNVLEDIIEKEVEKRIRIIKEKTKIRKVKSNKRKLVF
jgi:hypothetical protein